MLQASCQLREAADASEVPNVAIHIAASPDRFGLRGRLAVIPATAALLRSFSCAPLCGVNASRRSAELASRRFPLPRGWGDTGAVGRAGGRARPRPPPPPSSSFCSVVGAGDRCSESSDSDGVRPRRRSSFESFV